MSKIIYIDVDDTFVRSFGSKRVSIVHIIELIKKLKEAGATLYCWSSGGAEYAKSSAEEFGIADCFTVFLAKPELMIDDMPLSKWRLTELHPAECYGASIEELLNK
jgi:phosphoserine phosphatase